MQRLILKAANALVSLVVTVTLIVIGLYAGYALWDNNQIYAAAQNVQADMLLLKPKPNEEGDLGPSFEELLAVNEDVCAWVTLDNTRVDYPVVQGETNLTYINMDVYGNYSLAGSIFLDVRCDREFEECYSLLYGHHMANGSMFGDLALYKDEEFFEENRTGTLMLPGKVYALEIFACLVVKSTDQAIFQPERWQNDIDDFLDYVRENALYFDGDMIDAMLAVEVETEETPRILAMSTCSSEFTDARTVILAVRNEDMPKE